MEAPILLAGGVANRSLGEVEMKRFVLCFGSYNHNPYILTVILLNSFQ